MYRDDLAAARARIEALEADNRAMAEIAHTCKREHGDRRPILSIDWATPGCPLWLVVLLAVGGWIVPMGYVTWHLIWGFR